MMKSTSALFASLHIHEQVLLAYQPNGPIELVNEEHMRGDLAKNHAREVASSSRTLIDMASLVAQMSHEMDFRGSLFVLYNSNADRAAETFQRVVPGGKDRMRHLHCLPAAAHTAVKLVKAI